MIHAVIVVVTPFSLDLLIGSGGGGRLRCLFENELFVVLRLILPIGLVVCICILYIPLMHAVFSSLQYLERPFFDTQLEWRINS